jgi:hypothetical protein
MLAFGWFAVGILYVIIGFRLIDIAPNSPLTHNEYLMLGLVFMINATILAKLDSVSNKLK